MIQNGQSLQNNNTEHGISEVNNTPKSTEEKLLVAVRVRPLKPDEGPRIVHVIDDKTLVLSNDGSKREGPRRHRVTDRHYVYHRVFAEDSTQEEVYSVVCAPLVSGALVGYAGAVFAYGATGAGKTHTMRGLMKQALAHIFDDDAAKGATQDDDFQVMMSYLEIYNENIRDLLNPSTSALELREEGVGALAVAGLTEVRARSPAEAARLLEKGERARTAEPTEANQASSRGHALLGITVCRSNIATTGNEPSGASRGRLFLVDLAGSERAGRGARRLEGAHINRSLLALGNCINALSGGARYVNYRDSKLTRLLREALGGRCRTAMVAHVAPAASHRDTTRNTLAYALRAATITTKVEREVVKPPLHASQYHNVISDLRDQISRLKMKMKENRPRSANSTKGNDGNPKVQNQNSNERPPVEQGEENNQSVAHLKALRHAIVSTFKEQMRLRRRLVELDSHLLGLALDAERQHAVISHWEARFNRLYKPHATPGSRLSTQQSYSRRGVDALETSSAVERGEAEVAAEQAWAELAAVEREQERVRGLRDETERQLQEVRVRGARLEEDLPSRIGSESERELLSLVCRVHELEADKLALQGERAARRHELRRRDLAVRRREAQRALADEIVAVQKRMLDASGLRAPAELTELYALYQQEIHAAAYADSTEIADAYKLPPISASGSDNMTWSSESSGGSGSARGSSSGERVFVVGDGRAGEAGGAGGAGGEWSWRLPQLQPTPAPRPRTRYSFSSGHTMKRFSSEDSLVTAAGSHLGH